MDERQHKGTSHLGTLLRGRQLREISFLIEVPEWYWTLIGSRFARPLNGLGVPPGAVGLLQETSVQLFNLK